MRTSLALDSTCHNALDDVLLAGHIQDDDGDDGNDDAGHHGGQLHTTVATTEVLDGHGDGAVLLDVQNQGGQQVVVPHPHGFQNGGGDIDFADKSVTENTRVSYPIYHIENIVKPISKGPHAQQVIFLSADAFGVLPPVSILNPEQAQYYFLSGFTAKLAGTERGITEPTPTFSACFGAAFLSLHPTKYAEELVKKMEKVGAKAYLVNTGWNGTGKRISIRDTRGIIDAILDGSIDKAPTKVIPFFDFVVPTELPGVDSKILDPRDTYADAAQWDEKAKDLAGRFIKNFAKFTGNEAGKKLVAAGPKL